MTDKIDRNCDGIDFRKQSSVDDFVAKTQGMHFDLRNAAGLFSVSL